MAVVIPWGAFTCPPAWIFVLSLVETIHAIIGEGCIWQQGVSNPGREYGLPRLVARNTLEPCRLKCRLVDFRNPPRQCQGRALCHPQVLPPLIREMSTVDGLRDGLVQASSVLRQPLSTITRHWFFTFEPARGGVVDRLLFDPGALIADSLSS